MEFKDSEFMTAEQKKKVMVAMERFVASGFAKSKFTRDLYDHLHLHCGFIAHYNKDGFYACRFENPKGLMDTISQLEQAHRHGGSDYADINRSIAKLITTNEATLQRTARLKELEDLKVQKRAIDLRIAAIESKLAED